MTCLCGHRGFVGPSACVLEKGHEGVHKYGDYQQALAIAAAKELKTLRDQLAAAQAREVELIAHVERLREALQFYMDNGITESLYYKARDALAATPAQSLASLRNEALDNVLDLVDAYAKNNTDLRDAIRAMKELK